MNDPEIPQKGVRTKKGFPPVMEKRACSADLVLRETLVQISGETRCSTSNEGGRGGGRGGGGDGRSCTWMCDQAFLIDPLAMLVSLIKLGCSSGSREIVFCVSR